MLAFANSGGGLLLVGVVETGGHAHDLVPRPADETDQRGWREVLAHRVAPLLGDVEIRHVPTGPDGRGVWVVAVPRSRDGPHAVRLHGVARTEEGKAGHGLLYPVRDGIATRYLTERRSPPGIGNRSPGSTPTRTGSSPSWTTPPPACSPTPGWTSQYPSWQAAYLVVALVPTLPGEDTLDGRAVARAQQRVLSWRGGGWPGLESGIGGGTNTVQRRRVVLSGLLPGGSPTRPTGTEHAALRADGSAVAALFAATPVHDRSYYRGIDDDDVLVGGLTVEYELLAALGLLAGHASGTRAGARRCSPHSSSSRSPTGVTTRPGCA